MTPTHKQDMVQRIFDFNFSSSEEIRMRNNLHVQLVPCLPSILSPAGKKNNAFILNCNICPLFATLLLKKKNYQIMRGTPSPDAVIWRS